MIEKDVIPNIFFANSLNSITDLKNLIKSVVIEIIKEDSNFTISLTKQIMSIPESKAIILKNVQETYSGQEFNNAVDTVLLTSELKPIKRISGLEKTTGHYQYEDWEEHEPTLPEQITEMKEKINYFESARVIVPANMEPEINEDLLIQNTTLTQKANAIYEYIKTKVKPNWAGKTVIENEGIYSFFFEIIEEKLRWPEKLRGKRSAKKSIIERAVELHPDDLELVKNKSGNKITGLSLKPCVKRIDTYT